MATVSIVYHSGYGHTKLQAEAVLKGAASVAGVTAKIYTSEEATAKLDELDGADAIILGCPTYMGGISAGMKLFMEAAAKKWFTQAWKDKIGGAFTNSSNYSGDKLNTLVGLVINAMQQGMIFVGTGMLPAQGDEAGVKTTTGPNALSLNRLSSSIGPMSASFQVPAGEAPGKGDLETATLYGVRVATITKQFLAGKGK